LNRLHVYVCVSLPVSHGSVHHLQL
jgi:hypothetical protein